MSTIGAPSLSLAGITSGRTLGRPFISNSYGNQLTQGTNSERELFSRDPDSNNKITLNTGRGLKFDGTQWADTGRTIDTTKPQTIMIGFIHNGLFDIDGVIDGTGGRFYFGCNTGGRVSVAITSLSGYVIPNFVSGMYVQLSVVLDGDGNAKVYVNGEYIADKQYTPAVGNTAFYIGRLNDRIDTNTKTVRTGYYLIPEELSEQAIIAHYLKPETTLYWDNGELKSNIVSDTAIAKLSAGTEGFWYPLNESYSRGYIVNHAVKMVELTEGLTLSAAQTENGLHTVTFNATTKTIDFTIGAGATLSYNPLARLKIEGLDLTKAYGAHATIVSDGDITMHSFGRNANLFGKILNAGATELYEVFIPTNINDSFTFTINASTPATTATNVSVQVRYFELDSLEIVNFANSPMRNNAKNLNFGYQNGLIERDVLGLQTGLKTSTIDLLAGDSTPSITLPKTGWCLDWYNEGLSTNVELSTVSLDGLTTVTNTFTSATEVGFVYSLERIGDKVTKYINGVFDSEITLTQLGDSSITNFDGMEFGSMVTRLAGRTASEREDTINSIKSRHGVA